MDITPEAIERQRKQNAIEMDKRIADIARRMRDPLYPMAEDSPLRTVTDDELKTLIRTRYQEFEARHPH